MRKQETPRRPPQFPGKSGREAERLGQGSRRPCETHLRLATQKGAAGTRGGSASGDRGPSDASRQQGSPEPSPSPSPPPPASAGWEPAPAALLRRLNIHLSPPTSPQGESQPLETMSQTSACLGKKKKKLEKKPEIYFYISLYFLKEKKLILQLRKRPHPPDRAGRSPPDFSREDGATGRAGNEFSDGTRAGWRGSATQAPRGGARSRAWRRFRRATRGRRPGHPRSESCRRSFSAGEERSPTRGAS